MAGPLLGIPLWMWITGGGIAAGTVAVDQTGDTLEQAGDAAESFAKLTKWAVVAGGLYVSYRALQSGGVLK